MKGREVEVIKCLLENKDKELSINQVSKILKKDYKTIHNIVNRLVKLSIILIQPFGKAHKLILTKKLHPLIFEAEYQRNQELFENKDLKIIAEDLSKIPQQFIAILFGSYAKNTQAKHSDIDLLIITEEESKIDIALRIYPFKIHPTYITYKEFIHMLKSREFTVVSEATKKNYIFIGIEDFYRAVEHAYQ